MKQQSNKKQNKKDFWRNYIIIGILVIAAFLRFYLLDQVMSFIGDQGWFYISARDMLLTGSIPLVGITSSHTWLHQGPLWTYMLAGVLWVGHFNPVAGAYLTAAIGVLTVWLVYKIGSEIFTTRVGLIAAMIYAASPLVLISDQMAYHTSPISTLTLLLFYVLYKWINGYRWGFPLIVLLLTTLYNFELATFMFTPIVAVIVLYGIIKKTTWVKSILDKRIILLSLLALIIPMFPMILYDIHHGYPQTFKFALWIGYKISTVFGLPTIHPDAHSETFVSMIPFTTGELQAFIFLKSGIISWIMLAISILELLFLTFIKVKISKDNLVHPYTILLVFFIIPAAFYITEKTNSGAYWPIFFPTFAFMLALVFNALMQVPKWCYVSILFSLLYVGCNVYAFEESNYEAIQKGLTFTQHVEVAKQIIKESHGKEYNIVGTGHGSQYESFTTGYEYLTWWFGHGPSHAKQSLRFIVAETSSGIILKKAALKHI